MKAEMTYSPELRQCLEEIKAITKKYDCAAIVTLHDGQGMSEFGNLISEPTWSLIKLHPDGRIECGLRFKSEKEKTHRNINMLVHARDLMGINFLKLDGLITELKKYCEIDEGTPVQYPVEDREIKE